MTAFEAGEDGEAAAESPLNATAVNVYDVPLVRPVTIHEPADPVTVQNLVLSSTAVTR